MKPYLRLLVVLSFCISQTAFGQATTYGAGPDTAVGMNGATTDSATGATTTVGTGVVPGGLEEAAASIKAAVATIAALPAQAKAGGADFLISALPVMQSSAAEYESTRVACYGAQTTASTMCMEQTNPNIISTVAKVNLAVAGLNSLAVNDACKGMSKIMTMAQAGMTGFLAVCGAMRLKCNMACGTTSAALSKLSGSTSGAAYCQPLSPVGGAACSAVTTAYTSAIAKLKAALVLEANAADPTVRPVAAKVAICSKGYGLMLASGAVSLISIVKSMKESSKCEDDSDGGGSSSTASTASAATTATAAAATTGSSTTTGTSTSNTSTPETASNLIVAPEAPAATDTTTNSQVRTAAATANQAAGARGSLTSGGSSLSTSGASADLASSSVSEKASEYQAYMPGGTKDPSRNIAGQSAYEKEVTAAGGKSNWSKTRDAYRNLKTLEDE